MVALHLSLCLLTGSDWLGQKVTKSVVAYWDQDNPDAWLTDNRICALRRGMGLTDALPGAFVFRTRTRVLKNPRNLEALIAWLRDNGVTVLLVDTLASVSPYPESDPNAMSDAIGENFFPMVDAGITPIVLHHIGKDFVDNKGSNRRRTGVHAPRGSSALVAAVGAAFNLDKDGDGRVLECVKPRYGVVPKINLVYDEDGSMGSDDWKVTISNPSNRVSQVFVTQFVKEHGLEKTSSRKLVHALKLRGYITSQKTASLALSRVK